MKRRLPGSTLFPYTTLFRSLELGGAVDPAVAAHGVAVDILRAQREAGVAAHRVGAAKKVGFEEDRKSTRLNSSHRCISYAVLCLKKKTACDERGLRGPERER